MVSGKIILTFILTGLQFTKLVTLHCKTKEGL